MANTAYSKTFKSELDPYQLLTRYGLQLEVGAPIKDIPPEIRDFVRSDIICPCCKAGNTEIVSDSFSKNKKQSARQPHFRFKDTSPDTKNGHHPYCDTLPTPEGIESSENVFLSSRSRTKTTQYIRALVCCAIEDKFITPEDITEFRQWVFDLKKDNFLENTANEIQLVNSTILYARNARDFYDNIPDDITKEKFELFFKYLKPHDNVLLRKPANNKIARSKALRGAKVRRYPDVSKYEDYYLKVCTLAESAFINTSRHFDLKRSQNLAEAFLSFILYKCDWDVNSALEKLTELHSILIKDEKEIDLTLANIAGTNPFQNFMLYEFIRKVNTCPIEIPSDVEITPRPRNQT